MGPPYHFYIDLTRTPQDVAIRSQRNRNELNLVTGWLDAQHSGRFVLSSFWEQTNGRALRKVSNLCL